MKNKNKIIKSQGGNNMKKQIMAVTLTAAMLAGLAAVPVWADDAGSDEF